MTLTQDLAQGPLPGETPLFCCHIEWWESEPRLWCLGRKLEPRLTQTMEIFNSQWVATWDSASKPTRARGAAFPSNVGAAEYFRLVYGFTRSEWLEERARYEALKTRQATQNQTIAMRYAARPPSDEQLIKFRARSAFVSYCQSEGNISEETGPPNGTSTNR